jgi:hypothetical protein
MKWWAEGKIRLDFLELEVNDPVKSSGLMMHVLVLQTRLETLRRWVVVAVAAPTHRSLHAKLFEKLSILAAGLLAATVAVLYEVWGGFVLA